MTELSKVLADLTIAEKASLTAGGGIMSLGGLARLGIPEVFVTDGPSGVRGMSFPGVGGTPSTCIPCGSAIGATWNPETATQLGALVGREALERGCRGLLAPTVNLHRSPLAGRNFECYSEDPLLTGRLASGFIRGVQSQGVFATVKHFVGNEAEFERQTINSVIDERALRELYLLPFELAVKDSGVVGVMTSYNRVNGRWVTEQRHFLTEILRDEWGFRGLVMTDWWGVANTATSLGAGLDLEMPGPGRYLGSGLVQAVAAGLVDEGDVDRAVARLLGALDGAGALGPETAPSPGPSRPADRVLLRRAAAEATVLLTNDGTLPIGRDLAGGIAVLGAHAGSPCVVGGGSAQVTPFAVVRPLDALRSALGPDVDIVYERGVEVGRSATAIGRNVLRAPAGFEVERWSGSDFAGDLIERQTISELRMQVGGTMGELAGEWSLRARGSVVADEDGTFQLCLAQAGPTRVLIDGEVVLDGVASAPAPGGTEFFGRVSQDLVAEMSFTRGRPVEVVVETRSGDARGFGAFRVGFRTLDEDGLIERAVRAAAGADVAIVFVGTTDEWESEGIDRSSISLPRRQDELVRRVTEVNSRTVVVVNAGSLVDLPWVDDVAAVMQCWFGGEEMGSAVADIVTGSAEPGGRLPTTIPMVLEQNPSHDNFPGENGEVRYGEGIFMGYRGYEHRRIRPRFPFGHGLGYTTFEMGEPTLVQSSGDSGFPVTVRVPITNTGGRCGSSVVQCFVAPRAGRLARPPKELKAFERVDLDPGATAAVDIVLADRAFAYWDPGQADWEEVAERVRRPSGLRTREVRDRQPRGWRVDDGEYDILLGWSSEDIRARVSASIARAALLGWSTVP
ncbi:MAG TPA: glycoside hydrolase family 3 C-terminal domain-containing protein [Acidimicrobiales bacterium]|nr:glycoside hydrolase family 3 C-terminal domain-containing protein [Acidimicrobiales bacterium]